MKAGLRKGKKYEEIFGIEKSKEIKEKMRKAKIGVKGIGMSGKNHSEKTKKLIGEKGKGRKAWNKGKPHSKTTREKLRKNHKGMLGKHHKLETCKKISQSNTGKVRSLATRKYLSKINKGKPNPKNKINRLHIVLPTKDTSIEKKIQYQLKEIGIDYIAHYPILGQPDIYIPNQKLCIFADGCYWHGCHECKITLTKISPRAIRANQRWYGDFRIKHELELEGYKVIRIWEHDIEKPDFNITKYIKVN